MRTGDFSGVVAVNSAATTTSLVPRAVAQGFGLQIVGDPTIYQQFQLVGNQLAALPAPASGQTFTPFPGNVIPNEELDAAMKLIPYMQPAGDYN